MCLFLRNIMGRAGRIGPRGRNSYAVGLDVATLLLCLLPGLTRAPAPLLFPALAAAMFAAKKIQKEKGQDAEPFEMDVAQVINRLAASSAALESCPLCPPWPRRFL